MRRHDCPTLIITLTLFTNQVEPHQMPRDISPGNPCKHWRLLSGPSLSLQPDRDRNHDFPAIHSWFSFRLPFLVVHEAQLVLSFDLSLTL
jgi:hypothetical protein